MSERLGHLIGRSGISHEIEKVRSLISCLEVEYGGKVLNYPKNSTNSMNRATFGFGVSPSFVDAGLEIGDLLYKRRKPVIVFGKVGESVDSGLRTVDDPNYLWVPSVDLEVMHQALPSFLEMVDRVASQPVGFENGVRRSKKLINFRDLVIDPANRLVRRSGVRIRLTKTEFKLLYVLADSPDQLLEHSTILEKAWGSSVYSSNVVRAYVSRLKASLGPSLDGSPYFDPVAGGYRAVSSDEYFKVT